MPEINVITTHCKTLQFVWDDSGFRIPAGELLSAITLVTESQKVSVEIENHAVANYLFQKGYIDHDVDQMYHIANDTARDELIRLGNEVSDYIGKEIEAIPINQDIELKPSILIMQRSLS